MSVQHGPLSFVDACFGEDADVWLEHYYMDPQRARYLRTTVATSHWQYALDALQPVANRMVARTAHQFKEQQLTIKLRTLLVTRFGPDYVAVASARGRH